MDVSQSGCISITHRGRRVPLGNSVKTWLGIDPIDRLTSSNLQAIAICLKQDIGRIVLGGHQGQKDSIDLGCKNGPNFVSRFPEKLTSHMAQSCERDGIEFIETEAANRSIASFKSDEVVQFQCCLLSASSMGPGRGGTRGSELCNRYSRWTLALSLRIFSSATNRSPRCIDPSEAPLQPC